MAAESNRVRLEFPALEENVAVARSVAAQVAAVLDFTLPELEELRVAVSEAVSNAVLHAYDGPGEGGVVMEVRVEAGAVTVEVTDRGRGIADVDAARAAEYSTLEGHLGLGFAFMEAMSDRLEVESGPSHGTRVRLVKRPHGAAAAAGQSMP